MNRRWWAGPQLRSWQTAVQMGHTGHLWDWNGFMVLEDEPGVLRAGIVFSAKGVRFVTEASVEDVRTWRQASAEDVRMWRQADPSRLPA